MQAPNIKDREGHPEESADEMLRARDVAKIFGVSEPMAYAYMAQGRIPVIRLGRSVRVSRRELERWIAEQSAASLAA